jgi:hypothetical protein
MNLPAAVKDGGATCRPGEPLSPNFVTTGVCIALRSTLDLMLLRVKNVSCGPTPCTWSPRCDLNNVNSLTAALSAVLCTVCF